MTKRKKNRLVKILKNYFESNDIDSNTIDVEQMALEIGYRNKCYTTEDETSYYILDVSNEVENIDAIVNEIFDLSPPQGEIKILMITNSIKDKLYVNSPDYKKCLIDRLKAESKSLGKIRYTKDISAEFICSQPQKFEICIGNRVDKLTQELPTENVFGDVYIVPLVDIVKIYDKIGDSLFDLNVRYSINDVLNVEKEMKKTLTAYPEKFWFFNNGITIIVEKKYYNTNKAFTITLEDGDRFSVINGAQTITTAAKCFIENPSLENSNAKVLLRMIAVENISTSFPKEISVALNRQKSIWQMDIATTSVFVQTLNSKMQECDNGKICFELNKRGGTPTFKYYYYVDEFAQLVEAYLNQKPGSARSNKAKLIVGESDNSFHKFSRDDIFRNIVSVSDIKKYYTPVNCAYELLEAYKYCKVNDNESELKSAITKYAGYYFLAATIYCINGCTTQDFSDFQYPEKEYFLDFATHFTENFCEFLQSKGFNTVDSNDFKTESLYEAFKTSTNFNAYDLFIKSKI